MFLDHSIRIVRQRHLGKSYLTDKPLSRMYTSAVCRGDDERKARLGTGEMHEVHWSAYVCTWLAVLTGE